MSIDIAAEVKFSPTNDKGVYFVRLQDAEGTTIGTLFKDDSGWKSYNHAKKFTGHGSTRYMAARGLLEDYELANGLRDSEGRRVGHEVGTFNLWCVLSPEGTRQSPRWTDKADAIAHLASLQTPAVEPKTPAATKTAVDFDRIVQTAVEDADAIALTGNGETRTSLRRYRLVRLFGGHTLRELKDALTLPEMVAERGRLGRPLVKDDYVNLLVSKALRSLTENVEPTDEQLAHFEEVGRHAALADEQAAPALNGTIQAALRGRAVGDPFNTAIMKAFSKGYQAVRDEQAQAVLVEPQVPAGSPGTANQRVINDIADQMRCIEAGEHLRSSRHIEAECTGIVDDRSSETPVSEDELGVDDLEPFADGEDDEEDLFTVVAETVVEEVPVVTPVLVWSDGTVTGGVKELTDRLTAQAYGRDIDDEFTLYVTQGGALHLASTRQLSQTTDDDLWIHERFGVYAGDATEPVLVIDLRIDGRS